MQKYLTECISEANIDANVYGYYLGLKLETFINSNESYIPADILPCLFCPSLMEYPFTKIDGSAKTYAEGGDGIVHPVLYEYEFSCSNNEIYTDQVQKGTQDFIQLMNDGYGTEHIGYPIAYARMRSATKRPSLRDSMLLGNIKHINHGKKGCIAKPDSLIHYVLAPRRFKADFSWSGWKIGFLKRLIKIPLPYYAILQLIRRVMVKKYE